MIQEIILTKSIKNIRYSDGRDHSDLEINYNSYPNHRCVNCNGTNITITNVKDICHECGYVYH